MSLLSVNEMVRTIVGKKTTIGEIPNGKILRSSEIRKNEHYMD